MTADPTKRGCDVVSAFRRTLRSRAVLGQRAYVVDDVPDLLVLEHVLERRHVEVGTDALLDAGKDVAVGAAVFPRGIGQIRRGRDQVVPRPAFTADPVARRT